MKVLPAIDLKNGKCVRLRQGQAEDATIYSDSPVDMARHWQDEGAELLHIVDLDGAFAGEPRHLSTIADIASAIKIPIEVGGGLRTDDHVRMLLSAGASRVIIGTRAISEPSALQRLVGQFGSRIAVGIDARNGFVQINGWVKTTTSKATDLARMMADAGVSTIIYTDTATDGMLSGPNLGAMADICGAAPSVSIIASGGISSPADIASLKALKKMNLAGAIVGKALYERATTIRDLSAAAR